jgi:NAD(P)-dependent dehydrogenase (short-subunit alcohol dehydrogenase family)
MNTDSVANFGISRRWRLAICAVLAIVLVPAAGARIAAAESAAQEAPTVLITGANRGLGLEMARQYSAAGWRVIGTARKPDSAQELTATGAQVVQLDVTDQASVDRLARELAGRPIDMLINNAGIQPLMWKLDEIDIGTYEKALDVNTVGPVRTTLAFLPNLRSGTGRRIINITTDVSSIAGNTKGGFYGYRESKAALNMFNRSLASELGPEGFVCIVLHPGWVRTDLGGPNAPLGVEESVSGMRKVIESLEPSDNGEFLTWAGERLPW